MLPTTLPALPRLNAFWPVGDAGFPRRQLVTVEAPLSLPSRPSLLSPLLLPATLPLVLRVCCGPLHTDVPRDVNTTQRITSTSRVDFNSPHTLPVASSPFPFPFPFPFLLAALSRSFFFLSSRSASFFATHC